MATKKKAPAAEQVVEDIKQTDIPVETKSGGGTRNMETPTQPKKGLDLRNNSLEREIESKQPLLVSGTNIKSINGESVLGSGNLEVDRHFKGWWPDLATLKAAVTATPGDAAYVKDASPATTWSIYEYDSTASSDNYWADSGTDADTSNVQTFKTGEEVNEVAIDDTHLANPVSGALALAEDAKETNDEVFGTVIHSEEEVTGIVSGYFNTNQDSGNMPSNPLAAPASDPNRMCVKISVQEGDVFKVYGISGGTSASRIYATSDASYARMRRGSYTTSYRNTPLEITIQSGEVFLFVNLCDYDALTDKVERIVTVVTEGLTTKVEDLDERVSILEGQSSPILTEEIANWTRVDKTIVSNSGDITAGTQSSRHIVEFIPVRNGEKIHTQITFDSTGSRLLRVGFSEAYPHAGVTGANIVKDLTSVSMNEVLTAPFDGFLFAYFEYDDYYTVSYKYVIEKGDVKPFSILRNEKILCFGASTFQYLNSWSNKGVPAYLRDLTGAKVVRGAIAGTRLVPRGSGDYNALDISNLIHAWAVQDFTDVDAAVTTLSDNTITSIVNSIKAMPPDKTTIVTVYALENDVNNNLNFTWGNKNDYTNETVFGAVNTIVNDILTANPYIKIFWVSQNVSYHGSNGISDRTSANWCENYQYTNGDINGKTKPEIIEILKGQVERNHVPFIDIYHCGVTPANFGTFFLDNDNTHMYKGFDLLARRVAAGIVGNYY